MSDLPEINSRITTIDQLQQLPERSVLRCSTDELAEIRVLRDGEYGVKGYQGWADFDEAIEWDAPFTLLWVPEVRSE